MISTTSRVPRPPAQPRGSTTTTAKLADLPISVLLVARAGLERDARDALRRDALAVRPRALHHRREVLVAAVGGEVGQRAEVDRGEEALVVIAACVKGGERTYGRDSS